MAQIVLIAHNLRSTHNVGSLLRTADCLGVDRVYLTGYTPHPLQTNDTRLPHLAKKINAAVAKTALGAEHTVRWRHVSDIELCIRELKTKDYSIVGVEQDPRSIKITRMPHHSKIALIVGREVEGLEPAVRSVCDELIEIPMLGNKESLNVVQAAAIACYHCQFILSEH